jgi:hypothetical protein
MDEDAVLLLEHLPHLVDRDAGREVAKIDVLESAGLLGEVYAVARELVRQADAGGLAEGPPVG